MAEISMYQILSQKSYSEKKVEEIDVAQVLEDFSNIKTLSSAKEFLKEKFGLENEIKDFFLEKDCFLNVKEHKNFFEVNIERQKEHIIYCYKK